MPSDTKRRSVRGDYVLTAAAMEDAEAVYGDQRVHLRRLQIEGCYRVCAGCWRASQAHIHIEGAGP